MLGLIAAVAPTFMAWASWRGGIKNKQKLVEVHDLANSRLSEAIGSLAQANQKILALEKMLSEMIGANK